ncbi:MAG: pyridoxal-phosphate dependent enzyme, partial [Acidimicrobiales bacterium]
MTAVGNLFPADILSSSARFPLGVLPTPLVAAPRLGSHLGIDLFVKRDDLIGFAQAGTKTRALELLVADAQAQGCDCVVGCGGPDSNFLPALAAATRVAAMDCHLVCFGDRPGGSPPLPPNLAMAGAWGATITFTGDPDRERIETAADAYGAALAAAAGRRPYVLPRGGATPVGAAGSARAVA